MLNHKKCAKCKEPTHVHDLWYDPNTKKQVHNKCLSEKGKQLIWDVYLFVGQNKKESL